MADTLSELVRAELELPVEPKVGAMAAALAALYPNAARAVLFYGSCLRMAELDGLMLDFYLIVSSYEQAYGKTWLTRANRTIPPNVFPFAHKGLVAKYAVLSEADFARLNRSASLSVSVWARFAQPSRLVWSADGTAASAAVSAVAEAAPTLLCAARPMLDDEEEDRLALWRLGFALTYSAELRAERRHRAASVVDADPERYRRFTGPALEAAGIGRLGEKGRMMLAPVGAAERRKAARLWAKRRRHGKMLSIIRLAKASFTYAGGVDYLAWKISRHSGAEIRIKPWHRRWPLLAAFILLPQLLKRGAIR
ncbi:hypothetical protein [Sphingosinicella rhizophila]|uniref:Phosphatidate cytidylyltransferase n=1 Tax=Sphingosinicella rhizophila TaxID=3050082 RepID=A0ABU3Q593_9SPHN|nr:hypothetical protein [Sphingosinicella sp. GR2756]MDT9598571.1 hypothetical protein [Sphingosinicella sp. GR2756]